MARIRTLARVVFLAGFGAVVFVLIAAFVLTRTRMGQDFVRVQAVSRIASAINGELRVGQIRSPQLLLGGTFIDVVITDASGRPFLVADSIQLSYSLPRLLAGQIRFSRIVAHRPVVTLERLPGQASFNVTRIFVPRPNEAAPPDDAGAVPVGPAAPGRAPSAEPETPTEVVPEGAGRNEPGDSPSTQVAFRNLEIRDGRIDIVYPLEEGAPPPERGLWETLPGVDGRVRRVVFEDVNASIDEMRLVDPAFPGPLVVVDSLSAKGWVFDEPFELRRLTATAAWSDGGLRVDADRVLLAGTEASAQATVTPGADGTLVRAEVDARVLALADLRWAVPMLPPEGVGEARLSVTLRPGVTEVSWSEAEIALGDSRVSGEGSVALGAELTLDGVDMELAPLELHRLQAYLPDSLPVVGLLRGRVRLAGPASGPWVSAQVRLDQSMLGRAPTLADVTGIVHLDGSPGVTDLRARFDPAQLDVLSDLMPKLGIRGPGSIRLDATGRLADGIRFTADVHHRPVDLPESRVRGSGTISATEDEVFVDVDAQLEPLSFTSWRAYRPDLPLSGEVRGAARAVGPLSRLALVTDLETVAGRMTVDAEFDARDPLASYRLTGDLERFRISELLPRLPEPTTVTASFEAQGSGMGATSTGSATVEVQRSQLGQLDIDAAAARLRLADGFLHVDSLTASTSVTELSARGALPLSDSLGVGELRARFESSSLEGIRPFLMGDSLIARDTLSTLEREILMVEGVNPDTLPMAAEILVDGTATGSLTVRGSVRSFDVTGDAELRDVRYGTSYMGTATASFSASALPTPERVFGGSIEADSVLILDRGFARGRLAGEVGLGGGRLELDLDRDEAESYRARGTFMLDSAVTVADLDQLTLRFDDRVWNLGGPARVTWGPGLLDVRGFQLHRPDGNGMDVRLEGRVERGIEAALQLTARGIPLEVVARVLQLEGDLQGDLFLDARLGGVPARPTIAATFTGTGIGYGSIGLERLEGTLEYDERRIGTNVLATNGQRRVLEASGTIPVDLALIPVEQRVPDEPVDLSIAVDSFPAALALGLVESLEDVEGLLTGRFTVAGTVVSPSPSGTLRLSDGSALIADLGVRHTDVMADLELSPDGTVQVEGTLRSNGTMAVTGSVLLDTLSNPYLDLTAEGAGFLAADRADVLATIGGRVEVEGRYRRPLVQGTVSVEAGALYLDEVRRTSELVDLTDLSFLAVVDTAVSASQPLLAVGENPFLRNLRLDVTLGFNRNFWLRSNEMNVEIDGELLVFYDRTQRDLAMLGELQAVRGTYSRFGRQFQVQQGIVRFIGTPGLDPDLDILAVNRLRVRDGEPLNIFASVQGTLLDPRVTLSSDATPPIVQSELVSYLIFGRPTYELASNEFGLVQGEFGGLFGSAAGAGASLAFGALGTQLGAAVAQEIGVDYFAISQAQGATALGTGFESAFRATQVEVGWYVAQDVFLALLFRPLLGISSSGISGARLEWRATDLWTVEGFLEDRFARELNSGFSANEALQLPKIWGLFLAREWGY